MKSKNSINMSKQDIIFNSIVNIFVGIMFIIVALPILNIISSSVSSSNAVITGRVYIWPVEFSLSGYAAVLRDKNILGGYANTAFYTIVGTFVNVAVTLLAAYPLSRSDLPGKNIITFMFTFTMMFSGGMIPNYILNKSLGLVNTRAVMIIPGLFGVYNMIVVMTFFRNSVPRELLEAAHMDGCSDFKYFRSIAIPLAKPVIAVVSLYYAVGHWNSFFNAMIYLNDKSKYPLSIILRDILVSSKFSADVMSFEQIKAGGGAAEEVLKYALIIVANLPVWCAYPLVQRHFVNGVMMGSIKG